MQPVFLDHFEDSRLGRADSHPTHVHGVTREFARFYPTTDAVTRFQYDDLPAASYQLSGGGKPCKASPNHYDFRLATIGAVLSSAC
jgi:hypothetical protein